MQTIFLGIDVQNKVRGEKSSFEIPSSLQRVSIKAGEIRMKISFSFLLGSGQLSHNGLKLFDT